MNQFTGSIASLETAIKMLEGFLDENTQARPLHEVERDLLALSQQIGRAALSRYLDQLGTGEAGTHLDERREWRYHGIHKTTYRSIFGPVPIRRAYYHHGDEGGFCPLDAKLALPERSYSYVLQGLTLKLDTHNAYDEGRDTLAGLLGVTMPKAMAEAIVQEAARDVADFQRQLAVPANEGQVLVIQADGKGIPMVRPAEKEPGPKMRRKKGQKRNKKKMATLFTLNTLTPVAEQQPVALNRKTYGFLCSKREAFEQIVDIVRKRAVGRTRVLFLSDGDPDLAALQREFFPEAEPCVDWIHVVERLWVAAYAFHKEGCARANAWVEKRKEWLLSGKVGTVIRGLKQSLTTSTKLSAARREALASVIGYLEGVKDRIRYDTFYKHGLPIATGSVEGACRHLICDRMERSGMHWKEDGARAMLQLRSVHINGEARGFEEFRIRREQERLYGGRPGYAAAA